MCPASRPPGLRGARRAVRKPRPPPPLGTRRGVPHSDPSLPGAAVPPGTALEGRDPREGGASRGLPLLTPPPGEVRRKKFADYPAVIEDGLQRARAARSLPGRFGVAPRQCLRRGHTLSNARSRALRDAESWVEEFGDSRASPASLSLGSVVYVSAFACVPGCVCAPAVGGLPDGTPRRAPGWASGGLKLLLHRCNMSAIRVLFVKMLS